MPGDELAFAGFDVRVLDGILFGVDLPAAGALVGVGDDRGLLALDVPHCGLEPLRYVYKGRGAAHAGREHDPVQEPRPHLAPRPVLHPVRRVPRAVGGEAVVLLELHDATGCCGVGLGTAGLGPLLERGESFRVLGGADDGCDLPRAQPPGDHQAGVAGGLGDGRSGLLHDGERPGQPSAGLVDQAPGGPARPARRPGLAEAIESQTRALRELSRRALPDSDPGEQPSPIQATRAQWRRQAAATEAAALRRVRAERAARQAGTAAAVPQPAELRTTA